MIDLDIYKLTLSFYLNRSSMRRTKSFYKNFRFVEIYLDRKIFIYLFIQVLRLYAAG